MIGSEHVSQLLSDEQVGGQPIGEDFARGAAGSRATSSAPSASARTRSCTTSSASTARRTASRSTTSPGIERVYERAARDRPAARSSSSRSCRATSPRDPDATVFEYRGIISPPHDWDRWGELNRRLAARLVERFGIDEVARWGFEIWNEANLEVFWSGTQDEYFRLYDVAARAIKSVDERLLVGGPSTAAAGWIADFLDFVVAEGVAARLRLDAHVRQPAARRRPRAARRAGSTTSRSGGRSGARRPTHNNPISDAAFGRAVRPARDEERPGPRATRSPTGSSATTSRSSAGRRALLHGGFGLLTVGNLRKPRWWALALAEELGADLVELDLQRRRRRRRSSTAGRRSRGDGTVQLLLWNGTLDQAKSRRRPAARPDDPDRVRGPRRASATRRRSRASTRSTRISPPGWRGLEGLADAGRVGRAPARRPARRGAARRSRRSRRTPRARAAAADAGRRARATRTRVDLAPKGLAMARHG